MTLKNEMKAYRDRWIEVDAVIREERRTAPIELRWKQLNSAYALAKGLGLLRPDTTELTVFERWAKIKEKIPS